MTITVEVPSVLQHCCDGAAELCLSGSTVGAILDQIEQEYPALYRSVCNETGAIRPHVNIFVNVSLLSREDARARQLTSGDVVWFFQAVSGG